MPTTSTGLSRPPWVPEARVCAPPDCAERLAEVGVALVPVGPPVRPLVHGATPPSAASVPRRAAELIVAQFDKLAAAAERCDALVASGLMPAVAVAKSVAENLGVRSVFVSYCPICLPSPHHPPHPLPGRRFPAGRDRQPGAQRPGRPEL
jgi:vancomycin aglycone glucosyltransferase